MYRNDPAGVRIDLQQRAAFDADGCDDLPQAFVDGFIDPSLVKTNIRWSQS
jgi:hypothetical protein